MNLLFILIEVPPPFREMMDHTSCIKINGVFVYMIYSIISKNLKNNILFVYNLLYILCISIPVYYLQYVL